MKDQHRTQRTNDCELEHLAEAGFGPIDPDHILPPDQDGPIDEIISRSLPEIPGPGWTVAVARFGANEASVTAHGDRDLGRGLLSSQHGAGGEKFRGERTVLCSDDFELIELPPDSSVDDESSP